MRSFTLLLLTALPVSWDSIPCAVRPAFSNTIAIREGWRKTGSLVRRLHNPGALVYAGQHGAVRSTRGFASFASDAEGWYALDQDLIIKIRRGVPLRVAWAWIH